MPSAHQHRRRSRRRELRLLIAADPRWGAVFERTGRPPLRRREGGFAGLAQIIVGQQVSTASAAAIHGRLVAIGDPSDHTVILRARKDKLLRVGLSNAKVKTLKAIAKAIDSRRHRPCRARTISPPTPRMRRSSRCTASARGRPTSTFSPASATPMHGRPATSRLQEGAKLAFGLDARPTTKQMGPLAEGWRPWRAVAARLLWSYYRVARQREGVLLTPATPGPAPKAVTKPAPRKKRKPNGQ